MPTYNITPNYKTSKKQTAADWVLNTTVHPAPVGGKWYKTNDLQHAQVMTVTLDYISNSSTCIENLKETTKKGKTTEHGKYDGKIFAPVTWSDLTGNRSKTKVELVHAMVFDFDGLDPQTMADTLEAFNGMCHVAYSSFSHMSPAKNGACAFRVVVPFDKPVMATDYITKDRRGVWYVMAEMFPHLDESTKDPSRFWFLPSHRVDRKDTAFIKIADGALLDSDALIDAGYAINTGYSNTGTQATIPTAPIPTDNETADDRYRRTAVTGLYLIKDHTGQSRPFNWYIKNWDTLAHNASGHVQVIAEGGQSVGGAFINRSIDQLTGLVRYRCTSGRNRTHHDCIMTDHGLEISYSNRGGTWRPLDTVDNVIIMIHLLDINLWMDKRTGYTWYNDNRFCDYHYTEIQSLIRRRFYPSRRLPKMTVIDAVDAYCMQNQKDTLIEYLDGLEWDGVPRLKNLFIDYLQATNTQMNSIYAIRWGISAVARAYDWGCKVDTMLILKGLQGAGKSTFFKILAGSCSITGQSFFSDASIDVRSVDGLTKLRLAWLHEWAELSGMSRAEVSDVKKFLTTQVDQYRPKYGRKEVVMHRHSVIIGTVNDDEILQDSTGSRRFWIVSCGGTDGQRVYDEQTLLDNRAAIWAEAVHYYKQGVQWWLTAEEQTQSNHDNVQFETVDVHITMIEEWLDKNPRRVFTLAEMLDEVYTEEVETDAGSVVKRSKSVRPKSYLRWYSGALKNLGVTMLNDGRQCRHNGTRGRWYISPEQVADGVVNLDSWIAGDGEQINIEVRFSEDTGQPTHVKKAGYQWVDIQNLPIDKQDELRRRYDGGALRFDPNTRRYIK